MYEGEVSNEFHLLFGEMAYELEHCFPGFQRCSRPLQKRLEDFHIVIRGSNEFTNASTVTAAETGFQAAAQSVARATGLNIRIGTPDTYENFLWIVFINPSLLENSYDDFVEYRIARQEFFPLEEDRHSVLQSFEKFWGSNTPCVTLRKEYPDSVIRDAFIWVRTDIQPETMLQCAAEETFNSMGLNEPEGVETIFDLGPSSVEQNYSISDFHKLLLRVLHSNDIELGLSRVETEAALLQQVVAECGAK